MHIRQSAGTSETTQEIGNGSDLHTHGEFKLHVKDFLHLLLHTRLKAGALKDTVTKDGMQHNTEPLTERELLLKARYMPQLPSSRLEMGVLTDQTIEEGVHKIASHTKNKPYLPISRLQADPLKDDAIQEGTNDSKPLTELEVYLQVKARENKRVAQVRE